MSKKQTTSKKPAPAKAKSAAKPKAEKPAKDPKAKKRLSALDAAARVLAESTEPMNAKDMISAMEAKALWRSPTGKTPHATLYAAVVREIGAKGTDARFVKKDRGLFAARA